MKHIYKRLSSLAALSLALLSPVGAEPLPERNATARSANWHFADQSEAALNAKIANLNARIVDLEIAGTAPMRFDASLVKNGGPHTGNWWWFFDLTEARLNELTEELNARIIDLEVYRTGGRQRFAAILKSNTGAHRTGWFWFHGKNVNQIKQEYRSRNMRLIDVERYRSGGRTRFAAVMVDNRGSQAVDWAWFVGRSANQVAAHLREENMRPIDIEHYRSDGNSRYDVVLQAYRDGAQGTWYYHGIKTADMRHMLRRHGARIIDVEPLGGGRYDVVYLNNGISTEGHCGGRLRHFGNRLRNLMKARAIPGAQVAVVREGRLVYSCALGLADIGQAEHMKPDHLMRIMSISKPITVSALRQLASDGRIDLQDTMLDALGDRAPSGPFADARMRDITVEHLIAHRAGFYRDTPYDPMVSQSSTASDLGEATPLSCRQIMGFAIESFPLGFVPGTNPGSTENRRRAYSNLGYCILQQIIAENGRGTYAQYVKRKILTPAGITAMTIGKGRRAKRAANEVRYYDQPFAAKRNSPYPADTREMPRPYTYVVEAMAGHGGWLASANDLVRYAAFTPMRPYGTGPITHSGSLNGTKSLLIEYGGAHVAVIFNATPTDVRGEGSFTADAVTPLIQKAIDDVTRWPARDLWQAYGY